MASPENLFPAIDYQQFPGAAVGPLPAPAQLQREYRRREPETRPLHRIVRTHLETFLAEPSLHGGDGYPRFVERELRRYLDCGILAHGWYITD